MNEANFFIVGAAKAGTTSLHYYLNQHKDIYMLPIKEPNFFSSTDIIFDNFRQEIKDNYTHNLKTKLKDIYDKSKEIDFHRAFINKQSDYDCLVNRANLEPIIGDASPSYLFSTKAAENIYKYNPDSKIVIVLRNPVNRAFSHFLMNLQIGFTHYNNFYDEINYDYNLTEKGWGISNLYIELGQYHDQVKRYYDTFSKEQVKVMLFEDMLIDSKSFIDEIVSFLNLDSLSFEEVKKNVSQVPKNYLFYEVLRKFYKKSGLRGYLTPLKKVIKSNMLSPNNKPELTQESIQFIYAQVGDDIVQLEGLIDKNLSNWKKDIIQYG